VRPPNAGLFDLWMTTRANREAAWDPPVRIDELSSNLREFEPCLSESKLAIYFVKSDGSDPNIVVATRASTSEPFGTPVPVAGLLSTDYDGSPWLDDGELVTMFHSSRAGSITMFYASRDTRESPFSEPVPVSELEVDGFNEQDPWLSPDRRTLVYVSGTDGTYDMYIVTR
jgi:Tol biopolymer transport system component